MTQPPDSDPTFTHSAAVRRMGGLGGDPHFPDQLSQRYEFIDLLAQTGTEAALFHVKDNVLGHDAVIKLYDEPLSVRTEVLERIQGKEFAHLATLYDFGSVLAQGYEVLEWVPGGTLDAFLDSTPVPLDDATTEQVVRELSDAIDALHRLGGEVPLAHGDIRPANILVRTTDPLDLILADFGRSTWSSEQLVDYPRSPRWSAPEDAVVSAEGDWWSLGCIVYRCLTGKRPYEGLGDGAIVRLKHGHPFPADDIPEGSARDWRSLVKGLNAHQSEHRWGCQQVLEWLSGGTPQLPPEWDERVHLAAPPVTDTLPPIAFAGMDYLTLQELAVAMASHWSVAVDVLGDDNARHALEWALTDYAAHDHDVDFAHGVGQIMEQDCEPESRLSRLLHRLDPSLPAIFRTYSITRDGLYRLADASGNDHRSPEARALWDIDTQNILAAWGNDQPDSDYVKLESEWKSEFALWESAIGSHPVEVTPRLRSHARSRILMALLRGDAAERLRKDALGAGGRDASRIDWFRALTAEVEHPGHVVAGMHLAGLAQKQHRDAVAAEEAEKESRARARDAAAAIRAPRTRRCLRWVLPALALLAVGSLLFHILPARGISPLVSPADWVRFWTETVPWSWRGWLATATLPVLTLPALAVATLLVWRARDAHGTPTPTRHPLERRSMQAAIGYTTALAPFLIPATAYGWVRGLRLYAPDALWPRRGIRTISLAAGTVGLTGMALALWQTPTFRPDWLVLDGYAWDIDLLNNVAEEWPTAFVAPWQFAITNTYYYGESGSSFAPAGAGGTTVLLFVACLALLSFAGYDYVRRSPLGTWAMALLLVPGLIAAANAVLTYGLVGQNLLVDVVLAVILGYYIRNRYRTRNGVRAEGEGPS